MPHSNQFAFRIKKIFIRTLTFSRTSLLPKTRSESMVFPHLWSLFEVCSPRYYQGPQRGLESGEFSVTLLVSEDHATTGNIQILVGGANIWHHVPSKPELQLMALSGPVVPLQSRSVLPQKVTHKPGGRATTCDLVRVQQLCHNQTHLLEGAVYLFPAPG